MRLLAIDPSLTSTGVAVIDDQLAVTTRRVESGPPKRPRGDKTPVTLVERAVRQREIVRRAIHPGLVDDPPALVLIEGPSYASAGAGTWDRAGLWWAFVMGVQGFGIPIALVPPTVRAKWATGSGAAGKSPIAVHLSRMWPDLPANLSDDEWDAVCLGSIGAQYLGWLPVELGRHREQLAKVAWPELVAT